MAKLDAQLAALTARDTQLKGKRSAAQSDLNAVLTAREAHLLNGDLDDELIAAKHQSKVIAAESTLAGYENALRTVSASIADLETQIVNERDSIARKAASDALIADIASIEAQLAPWLASTRNLANGLAKLNIYEATSISNYLTNAAGELELAVGLVLPDASRTAVAILSGARPIPAVPTTTIAFVEAPPPPTTRIFLTKNAKWSDASGFQQIGQQYSDADLSPATAARAIRNGHAVAVDHPTRRELHGSRSVRHPNPASCVDLDDDTLPAPDANVRPDPIMHEPFQKIDRGPPRELRIAANRGFES